MKIQRIILPGAFLLLSHLCFSQTDFEKFVNTASSKDQLELSLAKQFLRVTEVEELKDLNKLSLDIYIKRDEFHLFSFIIEMGDGCTTGYCLSLDESGNMLDQVQTVTDCEIDLEKQSYMSASANVTKNLIEIMHEEERVLDPSDTSATLNNSETELLVYKSFYEVENDGYFVQLTAPKEVNLDRTYAIASQELLLAEDLEEYSKNELRLMRSEIMASYGHIFSDDKLQELYENIDWYTPIGDATDKLTDIEKRNIALIDSIILE